MAAERTESQRMWIEGSMLGAGVLLAVALFGMLNYLSMRHYRLLDWTSSKLYTLSEKSEKVLAGLDRDVDAVIYISPGSELFGPTDELLAQYAAAHPRFNKRVIDPARNILEARKLVAEYNVERENVIVIASGEDRRIIDEYDLAEFDYSGGQFGEGPRMKEFKGEEKITSAILELIEAEKPKIVLTRGHGEANDAFSRSENFEFEEWSPAETLAVPEDADLVVVAGPSTRFFQPELDLFKSYLAAGGRMLFLLDPFTSAGLYSDPLLKDWMALHGVEIGDNVVIDPNIQLPFYGAESLFSSSYGYHPIVENLDKSRRPVLLTVARSVQKSDDAPGEYEIAELVTTSEEAWGETDLENTEALAPDEGEVRGPISVAVAVSFKVPSDDDLAGLEDAESPETDDTVAEDTVADDTVVDDTVADEDIADEETSDDTDEETSEDTDEDLREARLVVVGDIDFATASQIDKAANRELLVNALNWLAQRERLIAIEGREPRQTRLSLAPDQYGTIYMIIMVILPGAATAAGITVYVRRRR